MQSLGLWLPVGTNCTTASQVLFPCSAQFFLLLEKLGQKPGWRPGNEAIVLYEVLKRASIAAVEFVTNCSC